MSTAKSPSHNFLSKRLNPPINGHRGAHPLFRTRNTHASDHGREHAGHEVRGRPRVRIYREPAGLLHHASAGGGTRHRFEPGRSSGSGEDPPKKTQVVYTGVCTWCVIPMTAHDIQHLAFFFLQFFWLRTEISLRVMSCFCFFSCSCFFLLL